MKSAQERHEYFEKHADMAVEIEYESGGRHWHYMKLSEVESFLDNRNEGEYFSDCDYVGKQSDAWVRNVLNHAYLNAIENRDWCKKHGISGSIDEVINFVIDKNLVPFPS